LDFVLPAFDFIGDRFDWGGDDYDLFDDGVDWGIASGVFSYVGIVIAFLSKLGT
jgi:hypothetical protein